MTEIICGIYKITSPSGRIYVGESKDICRRWRAYKRLNCKDQNGIYNSFLKYGVENHTFEIIEECAFDDLKCRERYWQDFYDSVFNGLNCILTECGELKREVSDETKEKLRLINTGKVRTDETKRKISESRLGEKNWNFGKKQSEETKKKVKETIGDIHFNIGKVHSQESIDKRWLTMGGVNGNSVKVINIETNEIFNCIKDAAVSLNMKYTTLHGYLKGRYFNKTPIRYYIENN